jgi:hypothetical protein
MNTSFSIYCSGSIAKGGSDEKKLCWTDAERHAISIGAEPSEVIFLNPDDPITDPTNTLGQFGRDMYQVMSASAVVVDARERRGVGIGVEMAAASALGTPIIVVAPPNSRYRTDRLEYRGAVIHDYVHPHVAALAWRVVDDFEGAGRALVGLAPTADRRNDLPSWLEPAILEYETNVLPEDPPMLEALAAIRRHR